MAFVKLLTVLESFIWPLVTIVYPLHASIRAIENNSVADNRKCLMYWVTCGFIMLFEFTSAKLIQWIPFWFYIKLVATLLLVARHFDGAVYAYDHFVRPCFSLNPGAFGYWLRINRDEFSASNSDNFVLLAKRFVQENGPEALEKVIDKVNSVEHKLANPLEVIKLEGSLTDTGPEATATTENSAITEVNVARALENGPEALEKEFDKVISVEHKLATGENIPVASVNIKEGNPGEVIKLECSLADTGPEATAPTENSAITEVNVARASEQHSQSSGPSNTQKEWTCALCQVCAPSEVVLYNHFQGKKHKANEEKLKGSKTQPIEKAGITGGCCELRVLSNLDNTERDGSQVYSQGDASQRDHLEGKEHKAMEKKLLGIPVVGQYKTISATYFENTNTPKVTPKEGMHMLPQFIKGAFSEAEKKPAVGAKGGNCESPGSSVPEETKKKWTCTLCQIFKMDEISLQQHFQGRKHKAKQMELSAKVSAALNKAVATAVLKCTGKPEVTPKGNASASLRNKKCVKKSEGKKVGDTGTEDKQIPLSKLWCEKCKLQCNSLSMLTDHLGGKRHKGSNNAE